MEKMAVALLVLHLIRGSQAQFCPSVTTFEVAPGNGPGVLVASWSINSTAFSRFIIQYSPTSRSSVSSKVVTLSELMVVGERVLVELPDLLNFTEYTVSVTPECMDGVSGLMQMETNTTIATIPSGRPNNFTWTLISGSGTPLINVNWPPILETQWNGIPRGYHVHLFRHNGEKILYRVPYPATTLVVLLVDGEYGLQITAVNRQGESDIYFESEPFKVGTPDERDTFLEYPYFYILIPGVLFLAIIVGIIIVIFKKLHERNKRSISFARGIDAHSLSYSKGFVNAIPLRDLSPHSPNTSTSMPVSSTVTSPSFSIQQHSHQFHHQQLANRPLPLSPDPALIPAEDVFVAPVSSHPSSMTRKLTHPGPLPMLEENVEPAGFVPMSRTMTDPSLGSVFSPVSTTSAPPPHQMQHAPQQQQRGQQRPRANTLGGIPSPYEVPDQNAPPHELQAQLGNAASAQRGNRGGGGSTIPPPPAHSPPPLTNITDLPHVFDDPHRHRHQQNTLPRAMASQRSFSTSAAQGRNIGGKGLPYMMSDGNIHDIMATEGEAPYNLPPDEVISTSSHGAGSEVPAGRHQSVERGRYPPYSYSSNQHQQPRNPGMLNGALSSSEQLGNFGAVGEGPIPPSCQLPPTGTGAGRDRKRESLFSESSTELSIGSNNNGDHMQLDKRDSLFSESSGELSMSGNRGTPAVSGGGAREISRNESVFSETSTELSVSSNNSKRHSPGWGGAKSDVGVSHRRQRSKSPPERETFSDVGAPHGLILHPQQNGFV